MKAIRAFSASVWAFEHNGSHYMIGFDSIRSWAKRIPKEIYDLLQEREFPPHEAYDADGLKGSEVMPFSVVETLFDQARKKVETPKGRWS